jgi:hypothetical protein
MKKTLTLIGVIVASLALAFGFGCAESWLFMKIANWVLGLFNVAFKLTFWQSFGICALLSFIGGFFKTTSSKK